jgi:hypothetical protein
MASRPDNEAVAIPTEVLTALLLALGDVQRAVGASGTSDAAAAATQARVIAALKGVEPYLRELSERRDASHRADVDAAHQRGHAEGLAAGHTDGHRAGHEAGKAAAEAARKGLIESLAAPVAVFAGTKGGQLALGSIALPLAILLLRACALGDPIASPSPAPVPGTQVEASSGP